MSLTTKARLAGIFLLITILGGVIAQGFIADQLVVTGDAAATARNILSNQNLIRIAYAIFMIEQVSQAATTALLCELLAPLEASVARIAAVCGYVGTGIKAMARLFFYAPLFVLGGASYFSAFDQKQLEALAYLMIRLNSQGAQIALVFFGFSTLLMGWLMFRATFLPRALGVVSMVGGAGWLAFVYPPLGSRFFVPIALFALLGCMVTIGWLLVRGVDEKKWRALAT